MNPTKKATPIITSTVAYEQNRILRNRIEEAINQYMKYINVDIDLDAAETMQGATMKYLCKDHGIAAIRLGELSEDEPYTALHSNDFTVSDLIYVLELLETEFASMYELADAFEHEKFTPRNGTMGKWRNTYKLEMTKLTWERNMQDGWQINIYNLIGTYLGTLITDDSGKLIFDI